MSHISKIDTKIKDLNILKKSLDALSMKYVEPENNQKIVVHGYGTDEDIEDCIFEIKTESKYSIGLRKVNEGYEFVADWWAIETFTGQKQDYYLNKITRQYAYDTIIEKVKGMGYSVVQEDEDTKQNIHITVRKWS